MFRLRLKDLRESKGISQKQLADFLNVSQGSIGNWESGIREPNFATVEKIANYFNVSVDYIMGRETPCPICGLDYVPNIPSEEEQHNIIHEKCLKAIEKFGFFWTGIERARKKETAYNALNDNSTSLEQKVHAAEDLCKTYFSRCLESWQFDVRHPDSKKFIAMLLNQEHFKSRFSQEVYDELVKKYGISEGIPEGQTYYPLTNCNIIDSKPLNPKLFEEYCILKKYNKLNEIGQKKVNDYIDDLSENPNYLKYSKEESIRIAAAPNVTPAEINLDSDKIDYTR